MRRQLCLILLSLWALGACAQPTQLNTAPPATPQPAAALARPVPPTPQPAAAQPPAQEQQQAALEALTLARQGGRFSAADGQSTTVLLQPLSSVTDPQPRWLAFSLGHGSGHAATLYRWQASGWQVLSSAALNAAVGLVNPADIVPLTIDGQRPWFMVGGLSGLGATCYELLSVDGETLTSRLSLCDRTLQGSVTDLDHDGSGEVLITLSAWAPPRAYRGAAEISIYRWDGQQLVRVAPQPLPGSASAGPRELNALALKQVQAGLWQDARATISQALAHDPGDPILKWNALHIRLNAEERARQIGSEQRRNQQVAPLVARLLDRLGYGDYAAALQVAQQHSPAELFAAAGGQTLPAATRESISAALRLQPELAAGYFFRAWVSYYDQGREPDQARRREQALADLQQAVAHAPEQQLFAAALAFLSRNEDQAPM